MNHTEQRKRLRALMAGSLCLSPASVFDPISARVAESVGYEIGLLSGSVASLTTLAAPDVVVLTLTELADQVRRIMRASKLSLIVDADHGYGNALNVMRTTQELEHAGVSAFTIEDTELPTPFGQDEGKPSLISLAEGVGKMRAALAARSDPSLMVVGRTAALPIEGIEGTVARARAYEAAGVDAIFLANIKSLAEVSAIHAAVKIPLISGNAPASITREDFAKNGVRIQLQGHQNIPTIVKALREIYTHLHGGGSPADLAPKMASAKEMAAVVGNDNFKKWQREFLH